MRSDVSGKLTTALSALIVLMLSHTGHAHHGFANHFDHSRELTLEGTVTEFNFRNPHVTIHFEVQNGDGEAESWVAETGGSSGFLRSGRISRDSLKAGDHIQIVGHPARVTEQEMRAVDVILPNGEKLHMANPYVTIPSIGADTVATAQESVTPNLSGLWMPNRGRSDPWPSEPPFTEAGQAVFETVNARDDPSLRCLFNVPNIMTGIGPYPLEIIQRDDKVMFLYEQMHQVRRIFLDGRRPLEEDSIVGHSTGRYEGDTLIVETTNVRPLKNAGPPLQVIQSAALRVTERYTRVDDFLQAEITIDDPIYYREPWTVLKVWTWSPDAVIYEYACDDPRFNPVFQRQE